MTKCKLEKSACQNLVLRTAEKGYFEDQLFFGCNNYPICEYIIPLHFEEKNITPHLKKLEHVFRLFVQSNSFIMATYGAVYFNLKSAAFLNYLLKKDIVYFGENVEIGRTRAKIFYSLFYHLYLIPSPEIKLYLINNFPNSYASLSTELKPRFIGGIDYENDLVDESEFIQYRDLDTYNR